MTLISPNWRWAVRRTSQAAQIILLPGNSDFRSPISVTNLPESRGEGLNLDAWGDFLEGFGQSRSIRLTVDRREIGTFAIPDAAAVARVFADCETGKLVGWGADPAGFGPGATRPRPVGDRFAWTRELAPGAPGSGPAVVFAVARLNLSREGAPERCTLMASNRLAQVDSRICGLLMNRGRFEPARDGSGNAVASVYLYELSVTRTTFIGTR